MKRLHLNWMGALLMVMMLAAATTYVPERGDYTFRTRLCLSPDGDGGEVVDSIIVYLTDAAGHVDSLVTGVLPLDPTMWNGIGELLEEDINFDGVPDLLVCEGPMNAAGNFVYDAFVWDSAAHRFVNVPGFDTIFNPTIDSDNKAITGWYRLDDDEEYTRHEWRDGKLVEVEHTVEHFDQ